MIDLSINKVGLEHNIQKAKENHIIIPTIAQMQNPDLIPEKIKAKLSTTGLWDVDPVNLFRISWHNEAKESGGLFQAVPNYVEIPTKLSGVPCRIVAMSGKWFPTGQRQRRPRRAHRPVGGHGGKACGPDEQGGQGSGHPVSEPVGGLSGDQVRRQSGKILRYFQIYPIFLHRRKQRRRQMKQEEKT